MANASAALQPVPLRRAAPQPRPGLTTSRRGSRQGEQSRAGRGDQEEGTGGKEGRGQEGRREERSGEGIRERDRELTGVQIYQLMGQLPKAADGQLDCVLFLDWWVREGRAQWEKQLAAREGGAGRDWSTMAGYPRAMGGGGGSGIIYDTAPVTSTGQDPVRLASMRGEGPALYGSIGQSSSSAAAAAASPLDPVLLPSSFRRS
eukprot:356900-Hanusia_phi.AAC.1